MRGSHPPNQSDPVLSLSTEKIQSSKKGTLSCGKPDVFPLHQPQKAELSRKNSRPPAFFSELFSALYLASSAFVREDKNKKKGKGTSTLDPAPNTTLCQQPVGWCAQQDVGTKCAVRKSTVSGQGQGTHKLSKTLSNCVAAGKTLLVQ